MTSHAHDIMCLHSCFANLSLDIFCWSPWPTTMIVSQYFSGWPIQIYNPLKNSNCVSLLPLKMFLKEWMNRWSNDRGPFSQSSGFLPVSWEQNHPHLSSVFCASFPFFFSVDLLRASPHAQWHLRSNLYPEHIPFPLSVCIPTFLDWARFFLGKPCLECWWSRKCPLAEKEPALSFLSCLK